jgi:hypothetical protein
MPGDFVVMLPFHRGPDSSPRMGVVAAEISQINKCRIDMHSASVYVSLCSEATTVPLCSSMIFCAAVMSAIADVSSKKVKRESVYTGV